MTTRQRWIPGGRKAIVAGGLLAASMVAAGACTPASSGPSAPPAAVAGASPAPATASPLATEAPTAEPAPSDPESPPPSASPTAACSVAISPTPDWGTTFHVLGAGFAPDTDVEVTFVAPSNSFTFGGPGGDVAPRLLHTTDDGRFGPWDVLYYDPSSDEGGDHELRFTDGECTASVAYSLAVDPPSPVAIACAVRVDRVPDWGRRFFVSGSGFEPRAKIGISVDEPPGLWTWPGEFKASKDGTFENWDLRYFEPVAGDGGTYVLHATDGTCTADVPFELPEP